MSKQKLFLVGIVVVLAALLVVQVGGSRTEAGVTTSEPRPADSPPLKVDPAAATMIQDVQGAGQFPSPQSQPFISPYAEEGLRISSGSPSVNLPE